MSERKEKVTSEMDFPASSYRKVPPLRVYKHKLGRAIGIGCKEGGFHAEQLDCQSTSSSVTH